MRTATLLLGTLSLLTATSAFPAVKRDREDDLFIRNMEHMNHEAEKRAEGLEPRARISTVSGSYLTTITRNHKTATVYIPYRSRVAISDTTTVGTPTTVATTGTTGPATVTKPPTTTTAATTTSTSATSTSNTLVVSSATPQATGSSYATDAINSHNQARAAHGAGTLTWSDTLAQYAANVANKCLFQHSGGPYGENLAAGAGQAVPVSQAVNWWMSEASQYNSSAPMYSHFTQVVWKATTQLGCASSQCNGIFDPKYGPATFVVCEYNPPGNSGNADNYRANVQP